MSAIRRAAAFGLALLATASLSGRVAQAEEGGADTASPASVQTTLRGDVAASRAALQRGLDWLVANQHPKGYWGSPATNLWDIYAPAPGSQRAFQVASAALALSALIENAGTESERSARDKALDYVVSAFDVRRIRPNTLYNTWALGYALEAMARALAMDLPVDRRVALIGACERCVELLERFEFVEGGWGYYNFSERTRRPGSGSTPFTTATILVALVEARARGIDVPQRLIKRAIHAIELCARPNGAYCYSPPHRIRGATAGINKIQGSLARTPACHLALHMAGRRIPQGKLDKALVDLETSGHFLRIARKYPIPHETWFANSGYFCLYGYYYAALLLDLASPALRLEHARHIAGHVRRMQEKDGSFWDYQLFGYHKAYGTGYAALVLGRCLRLMDAEESPEAVAPPGERAHASPE